MYLQCIISKKPSKKLIFCYEQKNLELKTYFLLASRKPLTKRAGSGSVIQCTVARIPDPSQYVTDLSQNDTDLEHCYQPF
jgi:hypothetical protein